MMPEDFDQHGGLVQCQASSGYKSAHSDKLVLITACDEDGPEGALSPMGKSTMNCDVSLTRGRRVVAPVLSHIMMLHRDAGSSGHCHGKLRTL